MNFLQGYLMALAIFNLVGWLLRSAIWLVQAITILCIDIVLRGTQYCLRALTALDVRYARAHYFAWKLRATWDSFLGREVPCFIVDDGDDPDDPDVKTRAERAWRARWDRK